MQQRSAEPYLIWQYRQMKIREKCDSEMFLSRPIICSTSSLNHSSSNHDTGVYNTVSCKARRNNAERAERSESQMHRRGWQTRSI